MRKEKMKYLKIGIYTGVGAALFIFLIRSVRFSEVALLVRSVDWRWTGAAFLLYMAANAIRAERFYLIVGGEIGRLNFFRIVCLQNFFNVILPFRLGELSYVALVRRGGRVSLSRGISSLLGARAFDLAAIVCFFLLSLLSVFGSVNESRAMMVTGFGILALISGGLGLLVYSDRFGAALQKILPALGGEVIKGLQELRRERMVWKTGLLSILIWLIMFLWAYLLFIGIGLEQSFPRILFVYSFPVFLSMTPLFLFGGFGSYEGSVAAPLLMLGVAKETAVVSGLVLHLEELLFVFLGAGIGYAVGLFFRPTTMNSETASRRSIL